MTTATPRQAQPQTSMAAAFTAAGYETIGAKLQRLMREAIIAGSGKLDASKDHFIAALTKSDDAAALLWQLFERERAAIIGRLFTETIVEMRGEKMPLPNAGEAREAGPQGHRASAEPAPHAAAEATIALPQGQDVHASAAAPTQKPSRLRYTESDRIARLSVLRTFRVNGRPLGEVTGLEARSWLRNHDRDGRFVRLIVEAVPDTMQINACVSEDEADKLFNLATEAGNAH